MFYANQNNQWFFKTNNLKYKNIKNGQFLLWEKFMSYSSVGTNRENMYESRVSWASL